jgi:hypothetical protein
MSKEDMNHPETQKRIVTPYAWLRQEITNLTESVSVDSPQFKAIDNYADLQFGIYLNAKDVDEIKGEIQQQKEGSPEYTTAYDQLSGLEKRYQERFVATSKYPDLAQDEFVLDVKRIKEDVKSMKKREERIKRRQSQPPPQQ